MSDVTTHAGNAFIARVRLMTRLGDADLLALDALLEDRRQLGAGQDLVKSGEPTDRLHIMLDGWAARYKLLRNGQRQITALVLPGDPCDLGGVLVGRQDSSVVTLTRSEVAVVPRDALLAAGRRYPGLADLLLWLTTLDNAQMGERIGSLGRRSARERIAHFFCEMLVRLAAVGLQSGSSCRLPLTQEVIGDTLGLTSVHVNRTLNVLRGDGLVELRDHRLTVKDWPMLKAVAGFAPAYLHLAGMRSADTPRPAFPGERGSAPAGRVMPAANM